MGRFYSRVSLYILPSDGWRQDVSNLAISARYPATINNLMVEQTNALFDKCNVKFFSCLKDI